MQRSHSKARREISIRDVYPELGEEQLKEAEGRLRRYLELSLRVYDRIRSDPTAYAEFRAAIRSRNQRSEPLKESEGGSCDSA